MVLAFLLIYFGVRSYRDNVAGAGAFRPRVRGGALIGLSRRCATWPPGK